MVSLDHASSLAASPENESNAQSRAMIHDIVDDLDALLLFIELPSRRVSVLRGRGSLGFTQAQIDVIRPLDLLVYEDQVRVEALVVGMFRDQLPLASIDVVMQDASGTLRPVGLTFQRVEEIGRTGVLLAMEDLRAEFRTS